MFIGDGYPFSSPPSIRMHGVSVGVAICGGLSSLSLSLSFFFFF